MQIRYDSYIRRYAKVHAQVHAQKCVKQHADACGHMHRQPDAYADSHRHAENHTCMHAATTPRTECTQTGRDRTRRCMLADTCGHAAIPRVHAASCGHAAVRRHAWPHAHGDTYTHAHAVAAARTCTGMCTCAQRVNAAHARVYRSASL